MKGISPLIAAVLLIAFTIAVGGIVSIFFTSLAKQTTSNVGSQGQALIACSGSSPTVDSAKYSTTAGAWSNISTVYSNPGSNTLSSITVYVTLPNGTTFSGTASDLSALGTGSKIIDVAPSTTQPSEVRVVGTCVSSQGNQSVSGSCLSAQACMSGVN